MRILYVEDDAVNRRVMQAMLSATGTEMAEAFDGQAGLEAVEAQEFDLVLMDLRMPVMDGMTTIRHIRARDDAKAKLPIIVVTADTSPTIRQDCIAAGADEVLHKPIVVKDLYALIGEVVTGRAG